MKIYGYSERGAMNALFYGMALDKERGEESMKLFIKDLAKIKGNFTDFELYNEFSLSEFGDPDMMIKAKNGNDDHVVFFIEAKVSCGEGFELSDELEHHKEYMKNGKYKKGHSSNLFFQLRLKHYFFQLRQHLYSKTLDQFQEKISLCDKLKKSRGRNRKIGENVVVKKMVHILKNCKEAYYIAIIPKQDPNQEQNQDPKKEEVIDNTDNFGFEILTITWEEIYDKFKGYVGEIFEFNQNEEKSQILKKPIYG